MVPQAQHLPRELTPRSHILAVNVEQVEQYGADNGKSTEQADATRDTEFEEHGPREEDAARGEGATA